MTATAWRCPACDYRSDAPLDVRGVQHVCPAKNGELVRLELPADEHRFYCGNTDCPTRSEPQNDGSYGRLFPVPAEELDDDGPWLCPDCRHKRHIAEVVDQAPSLTSEQVDRLRALLPPAN